MITIKLSSEIFSYQKINSTINIYSGYADIVIEYEDNYWVVSFTNCKYDEELTIRAFENYLIGLENS